jgi:penicillin-binding protein 1A
MDREIQEIMEYVYTHDEFFPQQPEGAIPFQSAMVVLDARDNSIRGIVGGRGEKTTVRGFCRASIGRRQPGSSIKPVSVYAPALELGLIDWGTPLPDRSFMTINGRSWPVNFPAGFEGTVSLQRAMASSKNTTAVHVLNWITPEYVFRFMHDDLNVRSLVEREVNAAGREFSDIGLAQLALGGLTHGVTPLELTASFGIFTNDGIFTKPRSFTRVEDARGTVIINNAPEQDVVLSAENAFIMTRLMQGVVDGPDPGATARGRLSMRANIEIAGKTGTTDDEKDLWFIGYTPYFICGVWFGYDTPTFINRRGTTPHLDLFNSVMDAIHQPVYDDPSTFEQLDTIVEAPHCIRSGMAPGPGCGRRMGIYAGDFAPSETCTVCRVVVAVVEEVEEDEENEDNNENENENNEESTETADNNESDNANEPPEATQPDILIEPEPEDEINIPPPEITEQPEAIIEEIDEPPLPTEEIIEAIIESYAQDSLIYGEIPTD